MVGGKLKTPMLRLLKITNFAIIDDLEIAFGPGLNVLTGETGAGKSIIFGALNLTLGARAGGDLVRAGAKEAIVESLFEIPDTAGGLAARSLLEDAGVEIEGGELIVRRRVAEAGRSRIYLNGVLGTASLLSGVGERLVNIHGQHAHQSLLRPASHLGLLDDFAQTSGESAALGEMVRNLKTAEERLGAHREGVRERAQRADLLRFQVEELEKAALRAGELVEVEAELPRLRNAGRLIEGAASLYDRLYEAEGSVVEKTGEIQRELEGMADLDQSLDTLADEAASAQAQLESLADSLRDYAEGIEHDPERLETLEARRALIREMIRKYGSDETECLAYLEESREQLAAISDEEGTEARLMAERDSLRTDLAKSALALSEKRAHAAQDLDARMEEALGELSLTGAKFETLITHTEDPEGFIKMDGRTVVVRADGVDRAQFHFSPNPGEPPRSLSRVASGGELSRLMLALESVLRRADLIPTLIFDEVDAGVGGAVAEVVGRKLKGVSASHQVLVVTHLPQVASLGNRHFRVEKHVEGDRTQTRVELLDDDERVEEIARMGTGLEITDAAREHAREMLEKAG